MYRRVVCSVSAVLLTTVALPAPTAGATPKAARSDQLQVKHLPAGFRFERVLPFKGRINHSGGSGSARQNVRVGTEKFWLALDTTLGGYLKEYRLRGKGKRIEVWVASDSDDISTNLQFQDGDCRNDERVRVTNRQIKYLIREFDRNIYPKERRAFSRPPDRNGSNPLIRRLVTEIPRRYYKGDGDNIVVLVDNVRDENFYDLNNSEQNTYIAGFFSGDLNELHDRNIMSIDGFDWIHRTGANPPHEPVPNDLCDSKPARPFLYEGVFAHEYQHLLEYYEDPDETLWLNEGLSDWAATLTGYFAPEKPITNRRFGSHIQCFLGYLSVQTDANPIPSDGGPENSLNLWDEQDELLCDYGAAHSMMQYLRTQFGKRFMKRLHRNNRNGLPGLNFLVRDVTEGSVDARDVVHRWNAMAALDAVLDDGATLNGGTDTDYRARRLNADINWESEDTYSESGAPPNGADYVRLRDASGYLSTGDLESISFDGAEELPPLPVEWSVDHDPPGRGGDPALFSGSGASFDRAIVQEVSVPETGQDPTLTFDTFYEIEEQWDFGFVQISTDGGETYRSLSNTDTRSDANRDAISEVQDNLPGFTGDSGCPEGSQLAEDCDPSWINQSFDLSSYAGQDVLIAFRYITDPAVDLAGWWIDDVRVGSRNLSNGNTLMDWQTPSSANPTEVNGFTVQLIAYDDEHEEAWLDQIPMGSGFQGSLDQAALDELFGDSDAEVVAALVSYDEPTEDIRQYAPYVLEVNGVTQPGG